MSEFHNLALTLSLAAAEAAPFMAASDGGHRNAALVALAEMLEANAQDILAANNKDLKEAENAGLSPAMLDRLALNDKRLTAMISGIKQVATLQNPIGMVLDGWTRPNGMRLSRVRTPLGVILIIFEARPNVTTDAASLCIKSGNACILRGGREALNTNKKLGEIIAAALEKAGLPSSAVQIVEEPDRELVPCLLAMDKYINLVIPRGGKGLVSTVMEHSRIPVLKHLDGVCHIYIDKSADIDMAEAIALNAKLSRPAACNAMETLLVHRDAAELFLPRCLGSLMKAGVELRVDQDVKDIADRIDITVTDATENDWRAEYNDLILAVKIVPDLQSAINHINTYGSKHTDCIVTASLESAEQFKLLVDSAAVMVNVSSRFSDGYEFGLGAEIGISTDKLHARGPVGLEGLTTYKWLVEGDGQVRM